jgi:type I restriction enzyme S subunit
MAVWSIVKVSKLEGPKRLDAEYYRPEYLKLKRFLSKHPLLGQCVEKIIHPVEIKRVYEDQGLPVLLAQNIQRNFLEFSVTVFMPESVRALILRNKLVPNDVVMTRSGANYGDTAAYFGEPDPLYACADDLVIRPKRDLPAGYLATFFNTDAGRALIKRGGYGAGQPHIAPTFLKTLYVPRFSRNVEQTVDGLVRLARDEIKHSESLYLQAERMLLEELGWDKLDLSQPKWWSISNSIARETERIDAEHFQPKHDKLIAHLRKTGRAKQVRDILAEPIQKGLTPEYEQEGSIVAVNSQHLGRYYLNFEATDRTTEEFWKANRTAQIRQNDVMIYATGAYIGRTNAYLEPARALAGVDILFVRPTNVCNPLYLAVFLNAQPGLMQSKRFASGSGQAHIYPKDVSRYSIYVPSGKFQEEVAGLVQQSYKARQKAKTLLEEAKLKVEALIEGTQN